MGSGVWGTPVYPTTNEWCGVQKMGRTCIAAVVLMQGETM